MVYVDGFLLPVKKENLAAYKAMSKKAGKIWKEHGALQYVECAGDDLDLKMGLPFPKAMKLKEGETAVFSWIAYESKAARNRVNKAVMKDPRIGAMMQGKEMPFDVKKMMYGGFKSIVEM